MKRMFSRLLVCAVAAAALLFVPGRAEAHTIHCVGRAAINTTDGDMTYTTNNTRTLEIWFPTLGGICRGSIAVTLHGTITGRCGTATGSGWANGTSDHDFEIAWTGTQMTLEGPNLVGSFTMVESENFIGETCVTGASTWFSPGVLSLTHL